MQNPKIMRWYLLGMFVLALLGLINVSNRFYYFSILAIGWLSIIFAIRQSGLKQPITAIALLLTTNLAFWCSYGLWKLRPQIIGPVQSGGIDPFSIAVSFWLIMLIVCILYECVVFIRSITDMQGQRCLSVFGLVGVVLQVLITLKTIYLLICGI